MSKTKAEIIESEVTSRLDDLFGEAQQDQPADGDTSGDSEESPILDLNAIVLSIEWEITDEILARYVDEVSRLKTLYRDDIILSSFLKLHGSIGKYLSLEKASAHPDAIRLLQSLFNGFEKVVNTPGMPDAEKKKIFSAEARKYKKLREEVLVAPKDAPAKDIAPAPKPPAADPKKETEMVAEKAPEIVLTAPTDGPVAEEILFKQEFLDLIRKEIQKLIQAEFKSLKEELKILMQG